MPVNLRWAVRQNRVTDGRRRVAVNEVAGSIPKILCAARSLSQFPPGPAASSHGPQPARSAAEAEMNVNIQREVEEK